LFSASYCSHDRGWAVDHQAHANLSDEALCDRETNLERVVVDTTVQEKAIAHPTDARLTHRAIEKLVDLAKREAVGRLSDGQSVYDAFELLSYVRRKSR